MLKKVQFRFVQFIILFLWISTAFGCQHKESGSATNDIDTISQNKTQIADKEVTIDYFGHACFLITTPCNVKILMDPVEFKGYHLPEGIEPDIVTVSHNHPDHNRTDVVAGVPAILLGCSTDNRTVNPIDTTINKVHIYTVSADHDPGGHGINAIFLLEFDGIKVAHLGDLGTTLSENQIEAMGLVDILMIPVGGQFTISGTEADEVIRQLNVRYLVFPMHYKTDAFNLPFSAEDFIAGKENCRRISGNKFILDLSNLPLKREIIVMDYR